MVCQRSAKFADNVHYVNYDSGDPATLGFRYPPEIEPIMSSGADPDATATGSALS